MIDKELLKLLGNGKKYLFYTVFLMVTGMLANIGMTACICAAFGFLMKNVEMTRYLLPAALVACCVAIRYIASRLTGDMRDLLGRKVKKDLQEAVYKKIVR